MGEEVFLILKLICIVESLPFLLLISPVPPSPTSMYKASSHDMKKPYKCIMVSTLRRGGDHHMKKTSKLTL